MHPGLYLLGFAIPTAISSSLGLRERDLEPQFQYDDDGDYLAARDGPFYGAFEEDHAIRKRGQIESHESHDPHEMVLPEKCTILKHIISEREMFVIYHCSQQLFDILELHYPWINTLSIELVNVKDNKNANFGKVRGIFQIAVITKDFGDIKGSAFYKQLDEYCQNESASRRTQLKGMGFLVSEEYKTEISKQAEGRSSNRYGPYHDWYYSKIQKKG